MDTMLGAKQSVGQASLTRRALQGYFRAQIGACQVTDFQPLGKGAHGTGYRVMVNAGGTVRSYVLKSINPVGLGHDYPSDRAAMHLLALDSFGGLREHVRAVDVLSLGHDGNVRAVNAGVDYYLLMETAEGRPYFEDLEAMAGRDSLNEHDRLRILRMAAYLATLHAQRPVEADNIDARALYLRKLRDTVGHGECLMGVLDTYPEGVMGYHEMAVIEKAAVDARARLKDKHHRLCQVHGDFHPGNIWWDGEGGQSLQSEMVLLDRSRGPWGEPADDVTALAINYIFYSVVRHGRMQGAYEEGLRLFLGEYTRLTEDKELPEVVGLFFAFRGVVVANPLFYPEVKKERRELLFRFVRNVLMDRRFSIDKMGQYLTEGVG